LSWNFIAFLLGVKELLNPGRFFGFLLFSITASALSMSSSGCVTLLKNAARVPSLAFESCCGLCLTSESCANVHLDPNLQRPFLKFQQTFLPSEEKKIISKHYTII